ncbi:MAG: lytic murein transglycosylase [Solirubrobacteraceae bacterium]
MNPQPHSHGFHVGARLALAGALALTLLPMSAVAAQGETAGGPAPAGAISTSNTETSTSTSTSTSTAPASEAPAGVHGQVSEPGASTETTPATGGEPGSTETTPTSTAPEVKAQSPQAASTPGGAGRSPSPHGHAHRRSGANGKEGPSNPAKPSTPPAPSPSTLTPPGWVGSGSLGAPISGVPDFFIESFRIPPFLLPIYQAAGTAYDIPWQVLAAINEVETDYGRDLSVSSAGAEGWMQFLPSSWAQYGVDANGAGYEDPYNPADAIFAAARYLQAAGGAGHIRAAIYSYNHSQAYVESVMLRAQLLGGTPPELLSAIAGLTESRFPVHAPAHFTDGFPVVSETGPPGAGGLGSGRSKTLAGTTIYSQAGAPVIAVQDGQITAVGDSPALGRYVSLRDAYGNTYTYAQLGSVAALYPVLEPRMQTAVSPRITRPGASWGGWGHRSPRPIVPASAGVQPHSPLSQAAVSSSLAMGAASGLETPPAPVAAAPPPALSAPPAPAVTPRVFRLGPDEVYLHPLVPGVQVLAGTVLGHVGTAGGQEAAPAQAPPVSTAPAPQLSPAGQPEPHMLFQIRPAGAGAPSIDPKPILDGWVRLEETSIFRAKGENPFLATSPTVGQVLLESKPQLERQVLRDPGVHLARCERGEVRASQVDRRVLATLEFLSVSGLSPTVAAASCGHRSSFPGVRNLSGAGAGDVVDISALDGTPIAGHEGPGSVADIAVRRLLRLQGTMKPAQIVSAFSYPGTDNTLTLPGYRGLIHVVFASPLSASSRLGARAARAIGSPLSPSQWIQLVARLGEIPEPAVAGKPSAAAIPDPGSGSPAGGSATGAGGSAGTAGVPGGSSTAAPATAPNASATPSGNAGGG